MKKIMVFVSLLAGMVICGAAFSQETTGQVNPLQAPQGQASPEQVDYGQVIIGSWKFDLGSGYMSTIEYLPDGTFSQQVDELIVKGTYKVTGKKLKTVTRGKATIFTIVSFDKKKLTIKRDRDGRTVVYEKQ